MLEILRGRLGEVRVKERPTPTATFISDAIQYVLAHDIYELQADHEHYDPLLYCDKCRSRKHHRYAVGEPLKNGIGEIVAYDLIYFCLNCGQERKYGSLSPACYGRKS
jgi:hypothetical protein